MKRFQIWIEREGGPRVVARLLGTESPTVRSWLAGISSPKALTMQKIVRLAKGAVSYDDIINETKRKGTR